MTCHLVTGNHAAKHHNGRIIQSELHVCQAIRLSEIQTVTCLVSEAVLFIELNWCCVY